MTDIRSLIHHFVSSKVISPGNEAEILALTLPVEQVKKFLVHILGPVKKGYVSGLCAMLKIMESHGNQTTQQIAVEMKERLFKEDGFAEKYVSFVYSRYLTYCGSLKQLCSLAKFLVYITLLIPRVVQQ